ncbi:ATP-binding protein [Roseateles aquae]|nr:ATP-binding protein [Paucibacter sp. APW11]
MQLRLLLSQLGMLLLLTTSTGGWSWYEVQRELDELLDAHLAQSAALLLAQQASELEEDEPQPDAPLLHTLSPQLGFQIWLRGQLLQRSVNMPTAAISTAEPGARTVQVGGEDWRVYTASGGGLRIHVAETLASRETLRLALRRNVLLPRLAAMPFMVLIVWWTLRRAMAPLRRLSGELRRRDGRELQPLAERELPTELQPLLAALNALFERIARLLEGERRFTADAAHELRTPIAAIRAQVQVALGAEHAAERDHALQATLGGCDRAARLVDQLLVLARLEAGEGGVAQPVELSALASQMLAEQADAALAKSQQLGLQAPDGGLRVLGYELLLTVLLRNLIDNAMRYSPAGAQIALQLQAAPEGQVLLQVDDSGPGLDEAVLARLGQRFFRPAGQAESGSGLGWSIVKRIAALHGARVALSRSTQLGGLCVQLWLPGVRQTDAAPSAQTLAPAS